MVAPSNSLNGTAGFSSTSELISEIQKLTICSSRTRKTESKISYVPGDRENQSKQI